MLDGIKKAEKDKAQKDFEKVKVIDEFLGIRLKYLEQNNAMLSKNDN